jgi:RHS repeat-associated protein
MANRSFSAAPPVCSRKNVRESEDQLSQVSTFSYDNNGNRISFRDANNVGQDCVYDARNRDTQCTDTMASVTKKFYDAHNNLVKTTDALLKDNLCAYDARDRKINCTDRLGGVTQYAYDATNNLTTLTDAQNGVTSYVFDPRNLMVTETYPDTRSRTYTYDAIRRLIKRVDQTNVATAYVYDHAGRMVERAYPAGTGNDTFVYDNASRLTSAASAQYNNAVNRIYDAASRLTSETLTVGATPYSIGYGYDDDNRQTQVIYPNGAIVDRTFTDRNQLESVAYNGVNAAILNYDNAGRLNTKTFGNGLIETKTYQADNLNTSINTPGVTNFAYTWDANKRKLSQTETGIPLNNQTYSYDDEDRLDSFNRNNGDNQAWNLSLVGDWNQFNNNGVMENRTHNAVHEITTVDANPLVHDLKGNLTQNKNGQTYAWDIENRLTTATDNQNNTLGTYTYDALGRRVSKTVGGNTTVFVSDGMQEIAEYVNGAFSQSYVYGSYIDEPLLKTDSAGNKIYYHANNLFSIAALTDAAGTVVERYKYDPYGKQTILAPDGITVRLNSLYGNRVSHTGRTKDNETGLIFYRTRYYDINNGRFLNRMPWHSIGGEVSTTDFLPLLAVIQNENWYIFLGEVLANAEGAYIQHRYNLYDYAKLSPIKFCEPFSAVPIPIRPMPSPAPYPVPRPWNTPGGRPIFDVPWTPTGPNSPIEVPTAPTDPEWTRDYYNDSEFPVEDNYNSLKSPLDKWRDMVNTGDLSEIKPVVPVIRQAWPCKEENKKLTCNDVPYNAYIKCDKLRDNGYQSYTKRGVEELFRRKFGRGVKYNKQPAQKGPCCQGSGYVVGLHWTVKAGERILPSVGECQCCRETLGGPLVERWYKWDW